MNTGAILSRWLDSGTSDRLRRCISIAVCFMNVIQHMKQIGVADRNPMSMDGSSISFLIRDFWGQKEFSLSWLSIGTTGSLRARYEKRKSKKDKRRQRRREAKEGATTEKRPDEEQPSEESDEEPKEGVPSLNKKQLKAMEKRLRDESLHVG